MAQLPTNQPKSHSKSNSKSQPTKYFPLTYDYNGHSKHGFIIKEEEIGDNYVCHTKEDLKKDKTIVIVMKKIPRLQERINNPRNGLEKEFPKAFFQQLLNYYDSLEGQFGYLGNNILLLPKK